MIEIASVGFPMGGYPHEGEKANLLDAYLLSCKFEFQEDRIPISVSLLGSKCPKDERASNNLRIHFHRYFCAY